ncbi:MAG TPA: hypothetical protein VHL77_07455, partial [Ferruginibacter sp.]|nr:hypothetical protein [Ferruginibacter sp.]
MNKFDPIIEKYKSRGVSAENIDYAIVAVKDGTRREYIIRNLTAVYRNNGMNVAEATSLLEELFAANGGEFKKENRGGYFYGLVLLLAGLSLAAYFYHIFTYQGIFPLRLFVGAAVLIVCGVGTLIVTLLGRYRDS